MASAEQAAVASYGQPKMSLSHCQLVGNKFFSCGIRSQGAAALILSHSRFQQNTATKAGGGVYCHGAAMLTVADCSFEKNVAKGAWACRDGAPFLVAEGLLTAMGC